MTVSDLCLKRRRKLKNLLEFLLTTLQVRSLPLIPILSFIQIPLPRFPPLPKATTMPTAGSPVLRRAQQLPGRVRGPCPLLPEAKLPSSPAPERQQPQGLGPRVPRVGTGRHCPECPGEGQTGLSRGGKGWEEQPTPSNWQSNSSNWEAFFPPCHSCKTCWQLKEASPMMACGSSCPCPCPCPIRGDNQLPPFSPGNVSTPDRENHREAPWTQATKHWGQSSGGPCSPPPDMLSF